MFSALAAVCTVDCAMEIVLITLHYITLHYTRVTVRRTDKHCWPAAIRTALMSRGKSLYGVEFIIAIQFHFASDLIDVKVQQANLTGT